MSGFFDFIEALYKLFLGGFGIRYLISAKYRKEVNERCRNMSKVDIFWEVFETIIGIVFLGVIVYVIATKMME